MSLSVRDLPVHLDGLDSGVARFVPDKTLQNTTETPELVLVENQPLLVSSEWYADFSLAGMYIVKKSLTKEEYLRIVIEELGGTVKFEDPYPPDITGVSTTDFLKHIIDRGYLMGPIRFSEINDYWGLRVC